MATRKKLARYAKTPSDILAGRKRGRLVQGKQFDGTYKNGRRISKFKGGKAKRGGGGG